jgi:hypothetical protein
LFGLRYQSVACLALLASCSVYDESLLADPRALGNGGALSNAGSASHVLDQAGRAEGGSNGMDPDRPNGGSGKPAGAGSSNGGNDGGSPPVAVAGGDGAGAGTGASSPAGGSAGSGAGGSANPPSGVDLLDDMEDGNFYLSPKPPRFGFWYVAGDTTVGAKLPKIEELIGVMSPARGASTNAVHFIASGFKGWGSSVGLSFTDAASKRTAYDAGNAVGVSFWVCGSVSDNAKLRVLFPIVGSDPSGKLCGGADQGQCLDHFSTQVAVTAGWQQVSILFSTLHQAGWGTPLSGFDPAQMLGIEWSAAISNVDVWVDDLALLRP